MNIDDIHLNFNAASLTIMNILIGFIMFGVALDLQSSDFKRSLKTPKPAIIGLICQFILLPAVTYLLVLIIQPRPSIALGLFLVAACPGGNLSNFLTYLAKGNTALSISMSAISTVLAIFMTPFNTLLWGSLYGPTNSLLKSFTISPQDMLVTIFLMLGLPLAVGMYIRHKYPAKALQINKWAKKVSIAFFLLFVLVSLAANFNYFIEFIGMVAIIVFIHNLLAITIGYTTSSLLKLPVADRRAISIEVGIQNSGLGLILIFNFFDGLGGMAIVAAWWAIWHIISGLTIATYWSKRPPLQETAQNPVGSVKT